MFWNEALREYQPHPDCTYGQGDDWKLRGVNRPCHCSFLRPLDADGKPIAYPIVDGLREKFGRTNVAQGGPF